MSEAMATTTVEVLRAALFVWVGGTPFSTLFVAQYYCLDLKGKNEYPAYPDTA